MNFIKNNIYPISLFIFVLLISLLLPYGGDDWINYLNKGMNFGEIINNALNFYQGWEGRFFSRIFLSILVPNKILWSILNAGLMVLLYLMIIKVIGDKYKKILFPLVLIIILFVNPNTFAQVYVWKTGNITYFIPFVYMLYLIYIRRGLLNGKDFKYKKLEYLLIITTFIFSIFVENVTVGIILVCLFNLIINYKLNKKIDFVMFGCLISSIIGLLIMLLSPGNFMRLSTTGDFYEMNLLGKLNYNFPYILEYTFIKSPLIIILSLIIIYNVYLKIFKSKFLTISFIIYFGLISLCAILISYFTCLKRVPFLVYITDCKRIDVQIYWIIFIIVLVIGLIWYFRKYKNYKSLYFILIGLFCNLAMMISPVWAFRTAYLTYIMFSIAFIIIILDLNSKIFDNKIFRIGGSVISIIFMICFTLYSGYIYKENLLRNKYINYQLKENKTSFEVLYLPDYYMCGINIWASAGPFAESFKEAYGIPKHASINTVIKNEIDVDLSRLNTSSKMKM